MSEFRSGRAAALIVLIVVALAATANAQPVVHVRLYDTGAATPAMRSVAIRTASAILAEAGVVIAWQDCTHDGRRPDCQKSRHANNLIVRLMPAFVGGATARGSALASRSHTDTADVQLGLAIIDPDTRTGEMATLFFEQVITVAERAGVDPGELLGRALAHEVGHLLLGVTGHSASGLMRAVWTDVELAQNRPADWLFASSDERRLRR
jgi:hypothetical protein